MKKLSLRLGLIMLIGQFLFGAVAPWALAQADDIVIKDNGSVVLIMTDNNVLGETTVKRSEPPKPAAGKVVPLVSPANPSTVHIDPVPTKGKQMNVSITPNTAQQASSGNSQKTNPAGGTAAAKPQAGTASPANTSLPSPAGTINKVVSQVVAQDAKGGAVFSVKPNSNGQVTLQQGATEVATSLPLEIDSKTRTIQVMVNNQPTKLSVLPAEAVTSISAKGLVTPPTAANAAQPQVVLVKNQERLEYQIKGEKSGKFLGILPVKTQVQVNVSAQTGNTLSVSQSPLFSIFGFLIR